MDLNFLPLKVHLKLVKPVNAIFMMKSRASNIFLILDN